MADHVTISASTAVRSLCDEAQGISEYVEEQYPRVVSPEKVVVIPLRLSGWVWRKERALVGRRYRRRFCVFDAQQTVLFIYSDYDVSSRVLLQQLELASATLWSRDDCVFDVKGKKKRDQELQKETVASRDRRANDLKRYVGCGQCQNEDDDSLVVERLKAVSAKACCVWAHCFKHHMKSCNVRKHAKERETDKRECDIGTTGVDGAVPDDQRQKEMDFEPSFVFEDATTKARRRFLPAVCSLWGSECIGLLSHSKAGEKSRARMVTKSKQHFEQKASGAFRSATSRVQFSESDRSDFGHSKLTVNKTSTAEAGTESLRQQDETRITTQNSTFHSELTRVLSDWESGELCPHRVDFDAVVLLKKLAAGACGEVWHALYRSQEVVVKKLPDEVTTGAKVPASSNSIETSDVHRKRRAILDFVQEIRIMSRLEHNRIVEFRGAAMSSENDLLLLMEFLPRGDLRTFLNTIKRKGKGTLEGNDSREHFQSIWTWTKHQWRLAIDIIEGLVYLHSLNPPLVHGDLKSANILLRSDLRAKLTDFGLSHYIVPNEDEEMQLDKGSKDAAEILQYGSRAYGTGRWMAPELIKCAAETSKESDVYAFGIVLSEIDTCELPFHDREKLVAYPSYALKSSARKNSSKDEDVSNESEIVHKIVRQGWKPTFRVTCPASIKMLAHECLSADPVKRPTSLAVAHRLRKAAKQRERPEVLAAQAKAATLLHVC